MQIYRKHFLKFRSFDLIIIAFSHYLKKYFKLKKDNVEVLPNGMSPQRGACVSSKAHPDKGSDKASGGALLCFGGLIKGRATNMAIALIDNKWYNSNINPNDDKAGFLAEMNLPLPLIDHSV